MRRTNAKLFARLAEAADPTVVVAAVADAVADTLLRAHEDRRVVDAFVRLERVLREKLPRDSRLARVASLADALADPRADSLADSRAHSHGAGRVDEHHAVEQARVAVVEALVSRPLDESADDEVLRAAVARFTERMMLGVLDPALAEQLVTLDVQSRHRAAVRDAVLRAARAIPMASGEAPSAFVARALAQVTGALRGSA